MKSPDPGWRFRAVPGPPEGVRAYYDRLYEGSGHGESERFYTWALGILGDRERGRLLDVGCGSGGFLRVAGGVGVDVSLRALQPVSGPAVVAYGEALPFRDGSFSRVTCLGSLEHFLDPLAAVREMARVMSPGGKALVMVPNSFYSGDIWRVIRTGFGPDHHQDPQRFATAGEWRWLLEEGGLRVEKVMRYNKFKRWKALLPFHLSYGFLFLCRGGDG